MGGIRVVFKKLTNYEKKDTFMRTRDTAFFINLQCVTNNN